MRDWLYPICFVRFQIEFLVQKIENFDELMVATAEEREIEDYKEQNWINMFWSYLCQEFLIKYKQQKNINWYT